MAPLYLETVHWREVRFLLLHGRHLEGSDIDCWKSLTLKVFEVITFLF